MIAMALSWLLLMEMVHCTASQAPSPWQVSHVEQYKKAGKIEDFCNFLSWFVSCVRLGSTTSGRSVSDIFHPLSSSKVKVQGMENLKWETSCWYMIPHRQSTIGDGSLTSINSEFTLKRRQQQVLWNKSNCTSDFS